MRAAPALGSARIVGALLVAGSLIAAVAGPAIAVSLSADTSSRYRVRPGDTLSAIARRSGVSLRAVAAANSIGDANFIVVGRTLVIPNRNGPVAQRTPAAGSAARTSTASPDVRRHPSALAGSRLRLMPVFELWAARYGMRADLLKAVAYLESGWHTRAISSTGAVGIGQLMPATATFVQQLIGQPLSLWNPSDNIHMSAKYLRWLLDQTGWNVRKAVASYYQGLGALRAHGMYADTVAYVSNVLALQTRF